MPEGMEKRKMKNKVLIGLFALLAVSILAFAGLTSAYRGDASVKGPNYNEDVHEQLEAAMEEGDYDAWLQIRKDNNLPMTGRMFQVINADNFDRYVAMHEAMESGDTETADAIRAELGLGQGMMKKGTGAGQGTGSGCTHTSGQKMSSGGMSSAQGSCANAGAAGTHNCGSCPLNK